MEIGKFKEIGIFAGGILFGTAGLKILGSKDAKKAYTNWHRRGAPCEGLCDEDGVCRSKTQKMFLRKRSRSMKKERQRKPNANRRIPAANRAHAVRKKLNRSDYIIDGTELFSAPFSRHRGVRVLQHGFAEFLLIKNEEEETLKFTIKHELKGRMRFHAAQRKCHAEKRIHYRTICRESTV